MRRTIDGGRGALFVTTLLVVSCLAALAAATPAWAVTPAPGDVWTWSTLDGPQHADDSYYDLAVGGPAAGVVYTAGAEDLDYGSHTGYLLTAKYDATGPGPIWTRAWRPIGSTLAVAQAVTVDAAGNVICAGVAWNGANFDIAVIKRDSMGTIVWWAVRPGAADRNDGVADVVTDAAGNVYVCGTLDGNAEAVVLKYAAAADPDSLLQKGQLVWERTTKATVSPGSVEAWGLAYGGGALYFTGSRTTKNGQDCFLRKLGRDGSTKWLRGWDGAAHLYDYGQVAAVFPKPGPDAVYVAGATETKGHSWDIALLKYSSAGRRLWVRTYDGAAHGGDEVWDMAVDGRGRARVAGSTFVAEGSVTKALLVAWSADGAKRWARTYRVKTGQQAAFATVVAGKDAIWVAGHADTATRREWVAARYGADGTRTWLTRWAGPPGDPRGGQVNGCALFTADKLFVTGAVGTAASGDDAAIAWFRR